MTGDWYYLIFYILMGDLAFVFGGNYISVGGGDVSGGGGTSKKTLTDAEVKLLDDVIAQCEEYEKSLRVNHDQKTADIININIYGPGGKQNIKPNKFDSDFSDMFTDAKQNNVNVSGGAHKAKSKKDITTLSESSDLRSTDQTFSDSNWGAEDVDAIDGISGEDISFDDEYKGIFSTGGGGIVDGYATGDSTGGDDDNDNNDDDNDDDNPIADLLESATPDVRGRGEIQSDLGSGFIVVSRALENF